MARPPVDEIAVALPPRKEVPWSSPRGKVGKAEQAVAGTWVAAVGDYASRTAYMAARMHAEPGPGGTWPSMQRDNQRKTNCVWLELTNDHRGERHECVMNEGKPGIASMIDPLSGQKLTDEVTFEWRFDPATRTLHVRYDKDVYLPALDDKGGTRLLRFRQWDATLGEKVGNGEAVQEYLPEHDYKVPVRYVFEIFSGHFVEGMDPAGAKK